MEYHIAIKHFHFKENSVWKNLVLREKSGFSMCMHCSSNSYKNVYLYIQKKNTGNVTNMPKSNGNKPNFDFHNL